MAVTLAPGLPDLDALGHIPTIYAAKLLVELYESTFLTEIANTDYEGTIAKKGNTVRIRTLPDIVIEDHDPGQNLKYQAPEPSYVDLVIDRGKYFALSLDMIQEHQTDIPIRSEWFQHGGTKLKIAIETDFLADIYTDVHASNTGATAGVISGDINLGALTAPKVVTKSNIVDFISECGQVLDEQNVPETGRFFIIPAWMATLIKQSDLKDASLSGDGVSPARNGKLGMIDRFTLYSSNLLKRQSDTTWNTNAIFGHKIATTFATQIVNSETLKNPFAFGDLLRALNVFGWAVIKPEALGRAYVVKG